MPISEKTILIIITMILVAFLIKSFKSELSGLIAALSGLGIVILAIFGCLVAMGILIAILAFGLMFSIPATAIVAIGLLIWYLRDKYKTWRVSRKFRKKRNMV